jgi:hypothetical protein
MRLINWVAAKAACATTVIAAAALVSFALPANAVTYSTSSLSLTGLGDQMGGASTYDQLIVTGVSNLAFPAGNTGGQITISNLQFIAGVNAYVPAINSLSFSENMTLSDGAGTQLVIPFTLSINYQDTLTILGKTFSFMDSGSLWQVAVNGLTIGPNPGGSMYGTLTAQVTDPPVGAAPLPAALPLFVSGLAAMGLIGWRRKRKNASTIAAT